MAKELAPEDLGCLYSPGCRQDVFSETGSERKGPLTVALGDCEKRRRGCPDMGGGVSDRGTRTRADVRCDFYTAGETSDVKRRGS
jgi:hypothetical protein